MDRCVALLLDFFPRGSVPEAGAFSILGHPAVSNLTRTPHIACMMKAEKYASGHCLILCN
jgi:hypothetical protein